MVFDLPRGPHHEASAEGIRKVHGQARVRRVGKRDERDERKEGKEREAREWRRAAMK